MGCKTKKNGRDRANKIALFTNPIVRADFDFDFDEDADLAELYGVQTRVLVQAVKGNTERFPAGVQGLDMTNCDIKSATRK